MTAEVLPLVERLYEAGNPRNLHDWESRDGYYVAACRVSPADVPDLVEMVRKWGDLTWSCASVSQIDQGDAELLPVTAWRTLADLKADGAVEPLVEIGSGGAGTRDARESPQFH